MSFLSHSCRGRHASSSVRAQHSGSSSPRQSVSITFSVCFPFVSPRCSIVASSSWQASSFEMAVVFLSSTPCPTCNTIEPASLFVCVRCPGCSSSASLTVSTLFLTSISENSPSASFASASVFSLFACAAAFLFRRFFFALTQFFVCGFSFFLSFFSMISWYFFRAQASHHQCFFQFDPFCRVLFSRACLSFHDGHPSSE